MSASKPPIISLRMRDIAALELRASGLETLRVLAGPGARALGHDLTPDCAFLAVDAHAASGDALRELVRSFVFLPKLGALVSFDIAISLDPPAAVAWTIEGATDAARLATILPRGARVTRAASGLTVSQAKAAAESLFLNVIHTADPRPVETIDSIDLAGVRLAGCVIAFHQETRMQRSAVSFDVGGPSALKFLITGLAPGEWEVWRAGMLEIPDGEVRPESGALYFEGAPGSYFLRRLGG
jgi:hypothetical protein